MTLKIGYLIKNIHDAMEKRSNANLKCYNLTFSQARVLMFLMNHEGIATQKQIEDFLKVSHPTVVGIVSRLEQNGYVTTWMDETDKRNKLVQHTPKAADVSHALSVQLQEQREELLGSLSKEDISKLETLLEVISQNFEKL